MRIFSKTALTIAAAVLTFSVGTACLHAADDEDDGKAAAVQQLAKEAMDKALVRGKEIWTNKDGAFKKSCASCHEDANKPNLNLKTRVFSYPAYHSKKKVIVTMQQKLQDMIVTQCRGTALDDKGTDIAAIEAYVNSLRK